MCRNRPGSTLGGGAELTWAAGPRIDRSATIMDLQSLLGDDAEALLPYEWKGRVPLINSGGESKGEDDLAQAVRTAVVNTRAGGSGLIVGRKAFQRPMPEGVALLQAVRDVYLDMAVTVA
jgi:hypothetical protein